MKSPLMRFWGVTMVGYVLIVLLLAGGMILTAWRFDEIASHHAARIRAEEAQITLVERLRWAGEAIVSRGRGYLISSDPTFLAELDEARAELEHLIEELSRGATDERSRQRLDDVQAAVTQFRAAQEKVVQALRSGTLHGLDRHFEADLLPSKQRLGHALDRLIDHKEGALDGVYQRIATERGRLRARLHLLLAVLVIASLAIAGYVASVLGRSYRQEREAVELARKAIAARDDIMAVVAHDLRNPLSAIAMRAALLDELVAAEPIRKHVGAIATVTDRMSTLIGSMLDAATIETGHFTVQPEPCRVPELVLETADMFTALAAPQQITLDTTELAAATIHADRARVLQVLANLVGNALKFTPAGGRIVLAAQACGADVCFSVADTGPGIAPEHLPHVFDRYWKHETNGKRGTGLGLFISHGIVVAHGGRIWVESTPGKGATFRFTLPCAGPLGARTRGTEPRAAA